MQGYDFLVIGGGSAGFAAARTAAQLGLKTALVEGAEQLGGLCILRGCMPSKTVIESARRFETILRAPEFGLHVDNPRISGPEINRRRERLVAEFAEYRVQQLENGPFDFIRGMARFLSPHEVEVTGKDQLKFSARAILVATGSHIDVPRIPGLHEAGYMTSDDALENDHPPDSLIVLGGGAVALEAAYHHLGLGKEVTLIQRSEQVLKEFDADIAGALTNALRDKGAKIFTGTQLCRIEKAGDRKRAVFLHEGREKNADAEEILAALGRSASIGGLNLEAAGVQTEDKKMSVNLQQQSNVPHIFAAGDVCGRFEIVHLAVQQGEIAARNAHALLKGSPLPERIDYRLKLYIIFTEPQVASLGLSEKEAVEQGVDYLSATYPFDDHGKSMLMGELHGFVKLLAAPASGEILGAAVTGPEAGDLIHEIAVAMHYRGAVHDLARIPHYHPTLSEIWTYPAEELSGKCNKNDKYPLQV